VKYLASSVTDQHEVGPRNVYLVSRLLQLNVLYSTYLGLDIPVPASLLIETLHDRTAGQWAGDAIRLGLDEYERQCP